MQPRANKGVFGYLVLIVRGLNGLVSRDEKGGRLIRGILNRKREDRAG